jgi:hypothetical protein
LDKLSVDGSMLLKWIGRKRGVWMRAGFIGFRIGSRLVKKKGKAVPLQAWTGPQGSRRSRLPDF